MTYSRRVWFRFKQALASIKLIGIIHPARVLLGGTVISQLLTVLALPVLTRIYSPEDFSFLAIYVAILTLISGVSCLRLEIAIPLPEADDIASNLLVLSLVSTAAIAFSCGLLLLFFKEPIFQVVGHPNLAKYSWLLPIGVLLSGFYSAILFWTMRMQRFVEIAQSRMIQSGTGLCAQLILGFTGTGPLGLMIGHALMAGGGGIKLASAALNFDSKAFSGISAVGMKDAIATYRRFPAYSVPETLANNAATQVPILIIATFASGPEAGFLLLAMRSLSTPVAMVGSAVSQVYLTHASREMRNGSLRQYTTRVVLRLARLSIIPLIFIALVAPWIFELAFGEEWRRAGEIVIWMTPWFVLKLLSSPVSMVMHVKLRQKAMFGLTTFGMALRITSVLVAVQYFPKLIVELYAVSGAFFYLVALIVFLRAAHSEQATLS